MIVAGSDDYPPYYDFAIARYEADGTVDRSFSDDGTTLTEFGATVGSMRSQFNRTAR